MTIGRLAAIRLRRLKRAEFFLDVLAQFPEVHGAGLQGAIFGRRGFPLGHGRGAAVGIQGHEHHQAACGILVLAVPRVTGADVDRDMHAGTAGVDQPRADFDDIADGDGFVERDAADGDGNAGESAPSGRARARAFVHPLHHGTAVNVPVHVPVFRAGKEAHRKLAISSWHGILLRGTRQACQMNGCRSRERHLPAPHVAADGCVGLAFGGSYHARSLFTHASARRADTQLIVLEDAEMARNGRCGLSATAGQRCSCRLRHRIHPLFLDQVGRVQQSGLDVIRLQAGVVF
jgi:hypothetical protein